jgi:3-oxoacyl-[acyl-carrier-protein] synthase II
MTRVVVTGLGAVTPLGGDLRTTWAQVLKGRSGIDHVTRFDATPFGTAIAGEARDFAPEKVFSAKELRHMDRNVQLGVVATMEAVANAGLDVRRGLGAEAGVVYSASGGYILLENHYRVFNESGPRRANPFLLANMLPDSASGYIAIRTGAMGPNMAVTSACSTGASAVGEAAEVIRRGDASIMIAGGAEAPITPPLYAAFSALRAIASAGDDPSKACKPFDRRRDGFVIAEGAGAVVLESLEHAQARGARIYAELAGYGASSDAFDMVAAEESGRGPALAIETALRKAALEPASIGYVNAHGTGTPLNDRVETVALKRVFGKHAYRFAISSTKSMTGHMMGAAGAVEAIFAVLSLDEQVLPPTINYEEPDPDCDLDCVPNQARLVSGLEATLSTSIGLGGHNAALIFRKPG